MEALLCPPDHKVLIESRNTAAVADYVAQFYERYDGRSPYEVSVLQQLHHLTIQGLYRCAGDFRDVTFDQNIRIEGASFRPAPAFQIRTEIRPFLDNAASWKQQDKLSLDSGESFVARISFAADCFHALLKMHPFAGGNGRVCRAFLHLMLYDMRVMLPGDHAIFEYISFRHDDYIRVLQSADGGDRDPLHRFVSRGVLDTKLEHLWKSIETGSLASQFTNWLRPELAAMRDGSARARLSDGDHGRFQDAFYDAIDGMLKDLDRRTIGDQPKSPSFWIE